MRLLRFPTVHGDQVVFTYAGDLWTSALKGGTARRLTSHPDLERNAFFSPDGKWIAFTGAYDGYPNVYVMPSEGGEPRRLTYDSTLDLVQGWTPDGKIAYRSTDGSFTNRQARLWLVSPNGGLPQRTPVIEVADLSFSPDGTKVVYNRQASDAFNWRRYRGGSQGVISIFDLKTGEYKELPHGRENSWRPMWVGDSIYFASDRNEQTVNLYRYELKTGKQTQLTHYSDEDIKWPSTDGKSIVFERDGYLNSFDLATSTVEKIEPRVLSDDLAARPRLIKLGGSISRMALSPSGVRVAVEARGRIFSVPAKAGITRMLDSKPGSRMRFPDWSSDGKTIVYLSDESGTTQIYTAPQMGGAPTQVSDYSGPDIVDLNWSPDAKSISFSTAANELYILDPATKKTSLVFKAKYNEADNYDWSPDAKYIAYIDAGPNQFGALHLYEISTGKDALVTEGYFRDDAVSFDLNGKYLYLISARTINPTPGDFEFGLNTTNAQRIYVLPLAKDTSNPLNPPEDEEGAPKKEAKEGKEEKPQTKVDFDGLAGRLLPLPLPAGSYSAIVGANNGVFYLSGPNLSKFTLGEKEPVQIGGPFRAVTFNASRSKFAYLSEAGLGVADPHPGIKPGEGKVDVSGVEAVIDLRKEWQQIYWEAWRFERDHFYDKNMLGLNWQAIGERYSKYLPYVTHRSDLNYVLGLMIGELGTSHAYVGGGDMGLMAPPTPVGMLGADYQVDAGKIRFQRIYRGLNFEEPRRGPLGDPGVDVREHDYLLSIDGKAVSKDVPPGALLVDKVGKLVELTVNDKPTEEGARKVKVRPIGSEANLRYIEWVEENRRQVAAASAGKIGYINVPDTSIQGMIEFIKGAYSQSDKEAVIIDERYNSGGFIPTFFIENLLRQVQAAGRQRNNADVTMPFQALPAIKVMLINGYAGSGGDMFPYLFRRNKIGPLIGTRTWGGLVGIGAGAPLVDGGSVTAPEFGIYDTQTGKWIAENEGITPDIQVDDRPDLVAKGLDPSLEKAIQVLMEELQKNPPKLKSPESFPTVKP